MKYKLNTEVIDYTAPTGEYAYQGTKHQVKDQLIELGILVPVEEKKCCGVCSPKSFGLPGFTCEICPCHKSAHDFFTASEEVKRPVYERALQKAQEEQEKICKSNNMTPNTNEQTVEEKLQCICVDDKDADSVDSGDICPIHTGDWKEEFDSLYEDLELDYPICCNGAIKGDVDCACNGESVRENIRHFISSLITRATAEADKKQFYAGFYEGVQNERAKTDKQIEEAVEGERERMFQTLLEKGFTVDKIMHDIVYDLRPSK